MNSNGNKVILMDIEKENTNSLPSILSSRRRSYN
jgi:hypothetical protein